MKKNKLMKKRVYGTAGIGCYMANLNADFTGYPKTNADGDIFGSDKALKYSIKHYWRSLSESVLFMKKLDIIDILNKEKKKTGEKMKAQDLAKRFQEEYGIKLDAKNITISEVLEKVLSSVDVMNFGCTFAFTGFNFGITGVVQVAQGMNIYDDTEIEVQDINSPFPSDDEKGQTAVGKKIAVNEAHYLYPFTVNPANYNNLVGKVKNFDGYTEEAYLKFKKAALHSVTNLDTSSKIGCRNEFAIFIELKEEDQSTLPYLDGFLIDLYKEGKYTVYNVEKIETLVKKSKHIIDKVEIYYNPYTTKVIGLENVKRFDIFSESEMDEDGK